MCMVAPREFKNHISYHTRVLLSFRWPNLLIIMHSASCLDMQGLMHVMPARPYPFYNSDNMVRGAHLMLPRSSPYSSIFLFLYSLSLAHSWETRARARMLLLFCAMCPVCTNTLTRLSEENIICDWLCVDNFWVAGAVWEIMVTQEGNLRNFLRICANFVHKYARHDCSNWKSDGKKSFSRFLLGGFFQLRPHVSLGT